MTYGDWLTEAESAAAFDEAVTSTGFFISYAEVPGTLVQPRPSQVAQSVRIDRVLIPNPALIQAGWRHGAIGVEIKRSKVNVGPVIAQAMDYSRCVWTIPNGIKVWLDWIFIWPMERHHGVIASILAQNRIGCARRDRWTPLQLKCGEQNILRVHRDGRCDIGTGTNGTRVGSR